MSNIGYIIVIFVMLVLSAFFSGSEISFNASNKKRLKKSAENGERTAKVAYKISENFAWALSAILIGNNLANIAASTAATALCINIFRKIVQGTGADGIAATVATILLTITVLIFGEIVPKILAKQHADKVVRWVAIPIRILTLILYPIVALVMLFVNILRKIWGKDNIDEPTVTEDELVSIIDTVEEEGVINENQSELLQSTITFQETTVEEIMTPRIEMTVIDINDDMPEILETIHSSCHSRIPVYDDSIDDIIGILILNHFYRATVGEEMREEDVDLRSMLISPCFIHKTMKLPDAMQQLREKETHIAIVIDEFGGTLGVVTMEDILEELVGEIWDENDTIVTQLRKTGENTYEVLGEMNIDDFFDEIGFEARDFTCEYSTVAGWAIEALDADPHVGDHFSYENLYMVVTEMDDLCVTKLTALLTPKKEEEEEI